MAKILEGKLKRESGSLVVEAAIIFPIVFLSVIAVLYIAIILFERAFLQSLADVSSQRGAAVWGNISRDICLGSVSKDEIKDGSLYWRLIDFQKKEKESRIKQYIENELSKHKLLMPAKKPQISIDVKEFITFRSIEVNINRKYKIPPGNILKTLGMTPYYTISVRAESVVNEPSEFIRNTDFVLDIEKEVEEKYPEYGALVRKIREGMNDIERKIAVFFAKSG